jgi:hypothetical protein
LRAGGELAGWDRGRGGCASSWPTRPRLYYSTTGHGCFIRLPTSQLSRQRWGEVVQRRAWSTSHPPRGRRRDTSRRCCTMSLWPPSPSTRKDMLIVCYGARGCRDSNDLKTNITADIQEISRSVWNQGRALVCWPPPPPAASPP